MFDPCVILESAFEYSCENGCDFSPPFCWGPKYVCSLWIVTDGSVSYYTLCEITALTGCDFPRPHNHFPEGLLLIRAQKEHHAPHSSADMLPP